MPAARRLRLLDCEDYAELRESRVGHYLRLDRLAGERIKLGRKTPRGHDLAVGEFIGYDRSTDLYYLSVPRARPWSHGFDKTCLYLVNEAGLETILLNLINDRPLQAGLELYRVQY